MNSENNNPILMQMLKMQQQQMQFMQLMLMEKYNSPSRMQQAFQQINNYSLSQTIAQPQIKSANENLDKN